MYDDPKLLLLILTVNAQEFWKAVFSFKKIPTP